MMVDVLFLTAFFAPPAAVVISAAAVAISAASRMLHQPAALRTAH